LQEEEDKIKEALFLSSSPSPTKQEPPAPCLSPPPPPTLDNSQQEEQETIQSLDESDVMEVEDRVPEEEEEREDIITKENEEEPVVAAAPVTTSMQEVEVNAEQEISASENSSSSSNGQSQGAASELPADVAVVKTTPAEEGKISMQMLPAVDDEGLSEKEFSAKDEAVDNNSLDGLLGLSEAGLASLGREELISALRTLASEQLRLGQEQQRLALRQGQIGDFMLRICSAMDQL
jgi:hypothetical protein